MKSQPPSGAPPGTIWFGGPVSRLRASLSVFGDGSFDANEVTRVLGCSPTRVTAVPVAKPRKKGWLLTLERDDGDADALVVELLGRVTSSARVWTRLIASYKVDIFCGVFLSSENQGFDLAPETLALVAKRGIRIGFDVYASEGGASHQSS
jgi:hypothetical protein